ncbi:MAG: hypothetical protein IJE00_08605 [Clostridia bacterium]|nr:hypothetical protein [Clostridia bacterium]
MKTKRMLQRMVCWAIVLCLLVMCCPSALLALADSSPTVYLRENEEYHAMTGFEAGDAVTINIGSAATDVTNNGGGSHKFTVGDNTFVSSLITFNGAYPLSEGNYLQFWLKNAATTDQYLMGMNFQGSNFQYNVPSGVQSLLIADDGSTETAVTWTNVRISGAGTIRTLKIPAGFAGYVRVSLDPKDLEVKTPVGGSFDAATFNTATRMALLFGNTATGGNLYMDDLGYVVEVPPVSVSNPIYTKKNETFHPIGGFEAEDTVSVNIGTVSTASKNNGYNSHKFTVGDNTFVSSLIELNGTYPLSEGKYLQFWLKNAATTDQYLMGMNFQGSNFQYNVPAGAQSLLIADGSTTETAVTWTNVRISGAGTIRTLKIPAGFSGFVRISLDPKDLEVKTPAGGSFDATAFDTAARMSLLFGNTATGGNLYMDDLGYITVIEKDKPVSVTNPIYTKPTETYYSISGFETEDAVTINVGSAATNIKNNGYNSHKFTVGNDTFISSTITLNALHPLSKGSYLQFWLKNDTGAEQYLMGMNFQGSNSQYNVPAGAKSWLIADGSTTETEVAWTNTHINGANTIRTLLIPADFSGFVRISILPKDLEVKVPAGGSFDDATFDGTKRIALLFGNKSTGGDLYMDDLAYVFDPDAVREEQPDTPVTPPSPPIEPTTNPIYLEKDETYHVMTGFEAEDTATVTAGETSADKVNNGFWSHHFTVGDNTFLSANISLNATYPLANAPYFQMWVHNAASNEQYLLGLSFQGKEFQFNVPVDAPAWLIANGQKTETSWKNRKINGAGTIRALAIPAGFSGYVRIPLGPDYLEAKVGAYSNATFNQTSLISLYLGNTASGGSIYFDDLGYVTNPNYEVPDDDKYQAVTNPIYLEKDETYHVITGFEVEDTVSSTIGVPVIDLKNNGYRSYQYEVPDNSYTHAVLNLRSTVPFATAKYLQLWVKNEATTDQYLLSVSLQGEGFQYNVPTGSPVSLIANGKKTDTVWSTVKINGGGTMRALLIPAGFSGYVRIALSPEHLSPLFGTYNVDLINKANRISVYLGNTEKGGNLYFDDVGIINHPSYTGLQRGDSVSNPIYLEKDETFYEMTGFEADDRVASSAGLPGMDIKNNGYQSHRFIVGDNTYISVRLTLNDAYPLSKAQYLQFWVNNTAKTDQYLLSTSFQGDGFQYNVPTGATAYLIEKGVQTASVWTSVRINGAGTMRGLLIPAGFSGYVRIPVSLYDLQPKTDRYNAEVFDKTLHLSLYLGNTEKGGSIYFDDLGYIIHANMPVPDYDPPGKFETGDIFLNEGDSYHLLTGFELDETNASVTPFNRDNHNVSDLKYNGHYSYRFMLPQANFQNVRIKFEATDKLATAEYLQFWITNPSNNNIYLFNFSFSDGNNFQYNIKDSAEVILISDKEDTKPTLAIWSHPNIGTFKGRSLVIPMGFSGYVRIPLSADSIKVSKPEDGVFDASVLATANQMAFYIGNIEKKRAVYMDDVMLIDGEVMPKPEEDYEIDYSMDTVIALYGQLKDSNGQPLKNTSLLLDNYTFARTDENGRFVFNGVSMDCHTLCVLDTDNKVIAQTAITVMPGDVTKLVGTYITRPITVIQLVVDMQVMGNGIKLLSVSEGALDVQENLPADNKPQEDVQKQLTEDGRGWILWTAIGAVVVAAVVVLLLLLKRKAKKN